MSSSDLADKIATYVRSEIELEASLRTSGSYPGDVQKRRNSAFRRLRDKAFDEMKDALK